MPKYAVIVHIQVEADDEEAAEQAAIEYVCENPEALVEIIRMNADIEEI